MTDADEKRIIIMTRLAAYDKNESAGDKRVNSYFLHDYISKNNLQTQIAVITGSLILIGFNILHRIFNEGLDITTLDYVAELRKYGLFIFGVALSYTVIGSLKAAKDYHGCQKRIRQYQDNIDKLAQYKKPQTKKHHKAEEPNVNNRNSIVYTRNTD